MIYYVQKKERIDNNGCIHVNFNVTLPPEAVVEMKLDKGDHHERAAMVVYDKVEKCITIKKLIK